MLERTNVQSTTGDALVTFSEDEGFFLYPRGRYVINLYANSFRIHGPSLLSFHSWIWVACVCVYVDVSPRYGPHPLPTDRLTD